MIVLVAGERQAEALDRVGDEADRPVVRARRFEGLEQRRQVVAAEIAHQRGELVVAAALDQRVTGALVAEVVDEPLAPGRAALEGQRGIELVGAARRSIARSASPPGSAKAACCSAPYLSMTTSQPKLRNIASNRSHSPSRTTASRLWRL